MNPVHPLALIQRAGPSFVHESPPPRGPPVELRPTDRAPVRPSVPRPATGATPPPSRDDGDTIRSGQASSVGVTSAIGSFADIVTRLLRQEMSESKKVEEIFLAC